MRPFAGLLSRGVGIRVLGLVLGTAALTACADYAYKPPPQAPVAVEAKKKQLGVTGAGSALERLTSDPVMETHPSISPDGRTLLFEVRVFENEDSNTIKQQTLVAIDPNTRAQRTLFTSANSLSDHPVWLPDQSSYVYASNSPGDWSLVRALTASPNAAVNVIASGEVAPSAAWPSISPDGKRVAFSTNIRGTDTIGTINLDGSRMTLLGEGSTPSYSPDGHQLAFSRNVNGHDQLFLVNADTGTDLIQLTSGEFESSSPSWSPDGQYLVFSTNRGWNAYHDGSAKRIFNLYILKKDGTGLTQLTDGDSLTNSPNWGHDGWVYFASNQAGNFDIWRLQPAGDYANLRAVMPAQTAHKDEKQPQAAVTPATPTVTQPTPGPFSPGCTKDTDCKGDRVCEHEQCVSPPPAATKPKTPGHP